MVVRLGGGNCPSSAPALLISAVFHLRWTFSLGTSSGTHAPCPSSDAPRSIHMRCYPSWWVHSLTHWAQSGRSPSTGQEYSPLLLLPLKIVGTGCLCSQRSPFLSQGYPSTRVASPAPCWFAAQHCFPAHSPGAQGWAVRPCVWGDIPPGSCCHSPSPWPLQSAYKFLPLWTCRWRQHACLPWQKNFLPCVIEGGNSFLALASMGELDSQAACLSQILFFIHFDFSTSPL